MNITALYSTKIMTGELLGAGYERAEGLLVACTFAGEDASHRPHRHVFRRVLVHRLRDRGQLEGAHRLARRHHL